MWFEKIPGGFDLALTGCCLCKKQQQTKKINEKRNEKSKRWAPERRGKEIPMEGGKKRKTRRKRKHKSKNKRGTRG